MKTLMVVVLALAVGGCVTKSTVTEGDRQVNRQTLGAAERAAELLELLAASVPENTEKYGLISGGAPARPGS